MKNTIQLKVIEKIKIGDAVHIDLKNQTARPTHFDKGDKWKDTALVSYEVGDEFTPNTDDIN